MAVGVILAQILLSWAIADTLNRAFRDRLASLVDGLSAAVEGGADRPLAVVRPPADPRFDQAYSGWYWQVTQGSTVLRSRSLWDSDLAPQAGEGGQLHAHRAVDPRGRALDVVERDIEIPGVSTPVHVTVAADREEIEGDIARLHLLVALCLLGLGGGLVAATVAQVRYGLGPLRALGQALDHLRETPDARVPEDQPAEIAPLARALNAVLDHDSALIGRARAHVGNLAHGLKTPLAVLSAATAEGDSVPAAIVRGETAAMARLVDRHLTRARSAAGSAASRGTRTPVLEVAERLRRTLLALLSRPVAITLRVDPAARFPGDGDDLMEILGNLMDNAGKWATAEMVVSARVSPSGGLILTVEDDGPGLPEGDHATARTRGARLDDSKPGHGLGLDIVDDLVSLHGGRLSMDHPPLGGLRVTMVFS
jgi:signal transduction histidine kinase